MTPRPPDATTQVRGTSEEIRLSHTKTYETKFRLVSEKGTNRMYVTYAMKRPIPAPTDRTSDCGMIRASH